jgi:hypothetical protein
MSDEFNRVWGSYFQETVVASGVLVPRLCEEDLRKFEDVAFGALNEISPIDYDTKLIHATPALANLAFETFGASFEELITVNCIVPFDWDEACRGGRTIDDCMLHFLNNSPHTCIAGDLLWFGNVHSMPPYLEGSYEATGLYVWGSLRAKDWAAWKTSLIALTKDIPVRPH